MSRSKRVLLVRASSVRVGDVVTLAHGVAVCVQKVYKGGGRLSFITSGGAPVDVDPFSVLRVLR